MCELVRAIRVFLHSHNLIVIIKIFMAEFELITVVAGDRGGAVG